MTAEEYGALLNTLLEAERAGAKLLSAYLDELPADFAELGSVRAVQRDEARNCAVLLDLLRASGTAPSGATGSFYEKGLAVQGWPERFAFLNRGQAWVAKRLAAALPEIPASARVALQEMHDSHLDNIRKCETLL